MTTQILKEFLPVSLFPGSGSNNSRETWSQENIPDLSGKVYIITGGSAGIGYGIVKGVLSKNPRKVIFLSSREHTALEKIDALKEEEEEAVAQETEKGGGSEEKGARGAQKIEEKVEWMKCDLDDLEEVDRVSLEMKKKCEELGRLDGIVMNAGIGIGPYRMSKNGIESHFQINHLSHMHMLLTLLPVLKDTIKTHNTNPRVVLQTSVNHRLCCSPVKFDSIDEINNDFGASERYNRSKLAQILFMHALIRRLESGKLPSHNCPLSGRSGIIVNATHPGVVWTDQMQQLQESWGLFGKALTTVMKGTVATDPVKEGCLPALYALTDGDLLKGMPPVYGQYIVPPNKVEEESELAKDEALQERLWTLSEELLRSKLGKVGNL